MISIHAPHTGRDKHRGSGGHAGADFNPRAPYGARLVLHALLHVVLDISIHAPHTGRDTSNPISENLPGAFQSTRPIRGATRISITRGSPNSLFQSTRPIRGATWRTGRRISRRRYFNPRAPYGARRRKRRKARPPTRFQSTRPIRGATVSYPYPGVPDVEVFQSTRPIRGATMVTGEPEPMEPISIHAPHTGRDYHGLRLYPDGGHFNPRAPYGARRTVVGLRVATAVGFQSTRPIRGATKPRGGDCQGRGISIHAPHTGRDPTIGRSASGLMNFNPRAPYGARPA